MPQASAQIYSAHKTIAVYQGTEDGVATFGVATYLRYAKADASKAEEPRHDLALPLAAADAHTALLSESAEGAISSVVASLTIDDRVELEWLQMRLPGAAFDSEPVRVCPKLARVTEAEEKALIEHGGARRWPAPGLGRRAAAGADLRARASRPSRRLEPPQSRQRRRHLACGSVTRPCVVMFDMNEEAPPDHRDARVLHVLSGAAEAGGRASG